MSRLEFENWRTKASERVALNVDAVGKIAR